MDCSRELFSRNLQGAIVVVAVETDPASSMGTPWVLRPGESYSGADLHPNYAVEELNEKARVSSSSR